MRGRRRRVRRGTRGRNALALATLIGLIACEWQPEPDGWGFERMIDQRRFDAYETADFFADSMVMRRPPEGTVHRDAVTGDPRVLTGRLTRDVRDSVVLAEAGGEGAAGVRRNRAPYVDRIPLRLTLADLERGRDRFGIYCAVCHGEDGSGESAVAENMMLRKPPSLLHGHLRAAPAGRIYSVITEGYGFMPSYAAQLGVTDRWAVVAYVRALQIADRVALDALPPEVRRAALDSLPGTVP